MSPNSTSPSTYFNDYHRYKELVEQIMKNAEGILLHHNLSFTSTIWTQFMTAMYRFGRDRSAGIRTLKLLISPGADQGIPVQIVALSNKSLDSQRYLNASQMVNSKHPNEAK
jgi:hypothetical protein